MKSLNLLLILSTLITPSFAHEGTGSGGGGGTVLVNSRPVLLDYFHVLKSTDESDYLSLSKLNAIQNPVSFEFKNREKTKDIRNQIPAFDFALSTLEKWQDLPMDTISSTTIGVFMAPLEWSFTNDKLLEPHFFIPPFAPTESKVMTAAYYSMTSKGNFSVKIHLPLWNEMNLLNQSGLLIHEALRQMQIGLMSDFSDEALQQATVIYMMCKPKSRLNYYLFYVLMNGPELARKAYGNFDDILAKSCERL